MSEEDLLDPCPICGRSALSGVGHQYACASCGTRVEESRWLKILPRNRFEFRTISAEYSSAQADLRARSFTKTELAQLSGSVYTDTDLQAIANGDIARLRLPTSTVAQVLFPHTRETCYIQVDDLLRAEGPSISDGVIHNHRAADRSHLRILDSGNLFASDQRIIFPSSTHTIIRLDGKLIGVCAFNNALAVQRKGESKATYFLGFERRSVLLVAAFLQGQLKHLR